MIASSYTVATGVTATFGAEDPAYLLQGGATEPYYGWGGADLNFTDQGDIAVSSSVDNATLSAFHASGGPYAYSVEITVASGASLSVDASGANANASGLSGYDGTVRDVGFFNDGTFSVSATGAAIGLASGILVRNTGTFTVSGQTAVGMTGALFAPYNASGQFTVTGVTSAIGFDLQGGTVNNTGAVSVSASGGSSIAYRLSGPSQTFYTFDITNGASGTISAQTAIQSVDLSSSGHSPTVTLHNGGTIHGDIDLGLGQTTTGYSGSSIYNTGSITGAIHLSANAPDLFDGRGGTLAGALYLGGGADTVYLGNDGETVIGGTGTAAIHAGAGADTISGGSGADVIYAGGGSDTLSGGGGADTFTFTTASGNSVITDFDPAEGDKIDLSALVGFYSLDALRAAATQPGSDTIIDLGGGASLTLSNVAKSSLTAADFVFGPIYVPTGASTVTLASGQTASYAGPGPAVSFQAASGGTFVNDGTVTVSSTGKAQGVVTTFTGTDAGAVFENDGSFTFTAGSLVSDFLGNGHSVVEAVTFKNNGAFAATINDSTFSFADMTASAYIPSATGATGDVLNTGSFSVQGVGQAAGVFDGNTGGLVQNGLGASMSVSASHGPATGVELINGGEFDNSGALTVAGSGQLNVASYGVILFDHLYGWSGYSKVVNSGSITVTGASSSSGVLLGGVRAVPAGQYNLVNTGTITAPVAVYGSQFGLGGTAVENSGTLNGEVLFNGSRGRLLNTGVINGLVSIGNGNGGDVLDSSAGTINGAVEIGWNGARATLGAEDNTVLVDGFATVDGGGGRNTVSFANSRYGATVSLALQGQAQFTGGRIDSLTNFQKLIGSAYRDTLEGGGSTSTTLTGGLGADTFVYKPGDKVVEITDFSHGQGDRIDLSAFHTITSLGSLMANTAQVAANTVISLPGGGTVTLANVLASSLRASDFVLQSVTSTIDNNFDGGSTSAVAFLNTSTGDLGYMTADGVGGQSWHPLGPTSTAYAAIAKGDFNGDGLSDIAFRHKDTGAWGFMSLNPSGGETWHDIGQSSLAYDPLGSGDFDGSGQVGIAFRNSTSGAWGYMTANASGGQSWHDIGPTSTAYSVVGIGDLDSSGHDSIAFRNDATGDLGYMSVSGSGTEVWHPIGPTGTAYATVGFGDFDGDGVLDVAFRNTATGDWGFMSIKPAGGETWHGVGPTSPAYSVIGSADYNGDGLSDLAFRNTAGDWGYMSYDPTAGGELWHGVGPTSTAYITI